MGRSAPVDRVVVALEDRGYCPQANGKGWAALCPAHTDKSPSLNVSEGNDGRALVHCHAGCDTSEILSKLGLSMSDLFVGNGNGGDDAAPSRNRKKKIAAEYDYTNADGNLLFQVVRYKPKGFRQRRPDGVDGWHWNMDGIGKRPLYNLPAVLKADRVLVVEGEKDADTLNGLGYVATTSAGGSGSAARTDWTPLNGRRVVLVPDNDNPGTKYRDEVAALLPAHSATEVRTVDPLPWGSGKDVTDWLADDHTADELAELIENAPMWEPDSPSTLTMRRGDMLIELNLPPPEPIVTPVINSGEVVEIVAFRGTGKTYFGLTLAVAIAAGVDPIPGWSVPTTRPTIYVDGELPHSTTQARVRAVYAGLGVDASVPMYTVCKTDEANRGRFKSLSTPEGRAEITRLVDGVSEAHGVMPVLFLDNLSCLLDSTDENSRESFAPVGEWMIELRGRGVTVVFFHHTGWDQNHSRGTSAREDATDLVMRLRAPGDRPSSDGARFEVLFDKARNLTGNAAEEFELHLEAAPEGGVVFSRTAKGERRDADQRAEILEAVGSKPGCSLNHVTTSVVGRAEDIGKLVREMIGTGELENKSRGQRFALYVVDTPGTTQGITETNDGGSYDRPDGNRAESPGNHLGTTSGTAGGSVVPTPTRGAGNHHGKPPTSAELPVDPARLPGKVKPRFDELVKLGHSAASAIEKVRAEYAADGREADEGV